MQEDLYIKANHQILKNHRVNGQMLLPGLAYIDILYQIFGEHGYGAEVLELRNLSIYYPLTVDENYDIALTIDCAESSIGKWQVCVHGQKWKNGTLLSEKTTYATTEMLLVTPTQYAEHIDVASLKRSAQKMTSLEDIYRGCREHGLVHEGFMKAEGVVYDLGSAMLVDITVPPNTVLSADDFMFHPVLVDGSAIGTAALLSTLGQAKDTLFLPLSYESFRASSLLQKHCYALVRANSLKRRNEIVFMTMEFFDYKGEKVGELKNLCNKLVRGGVLKEHSILEEVPNAIEHSRRAPVSGSATRGEAKIFLHQLMAERLRKPLEHINPTVGYYEMGLDSPMMLEVVKVIAERVSATLPPTLLFEYTSIDELADYLDKSFPQSFSSIAIAGDLIETIKETTPVPLEKGNSEEHTDDSNDIAIIGMAGRYPGADSIPEFWSNLKDGKDCITEIPESRWDWKSLEGLRSPSGKKISKWGGFLNNPDCFDAKFFRISPREAEFMDPQERIFLQSCWEAIEDAGYTPKNIVSPRGVNGRRQVGVFVGVMHKDYTLVGAEALFQGQPLPLSLNAAPIANRVSYYCNFHGPSMSIDTVCSSSLTAVHMAVESIRSGESEVALAGGVNLSLHPGKYMTYGMGDFHSSDSYCHSFGEGGDGYVSAEGVGVVVLKPLKKAIKDNDNIYAVIKGSAINHIGKVSGFTVPSPVGQADVINICLEKTGIDPRTISYVEAHGTGTSLGDPIEIQGLVNSYRQYTDDKQFCAIGSVKSNIGHAESAAGISGLSKVVLQLYHQTLVPSLHSEELNSHINFADSPFYVQHKLEKWEQPKLINNGHESFIPRRAGVSSFGATGSNAHILLEEYSPPKQSIDIGLEENGGKIPFLIPLSAKNKERLKVYAKKLLNHLAMGAQVEQNRGFNLRNLAYTLQVGRVAMEERLALIVEDVDDLSQQLSRYGDADNASAYYQGQVKYGGKGAMETLVVNEHTLENINNWISEGNFQKLAEMWVKGVDVDWELFYRVQPAPHRIGLPTYPFAEERYWIPVLEHNGSTPWVAASSVLHPLVHKNTSLLAEQRYSSLFNGQEFFVKDRGINGENLLPEFACLEMVREAVVQATAGQKAVQFKNVVWHEPIIIKEQPVQIHVALFAQDNGDIAYEIYGDPVTGDEPVIYSQGHIGFEPLEGAKKLDLAVLQGKLWSRTLTSSQYYEVLHAAGMAYGPAYRGIEALYQEGEEVLAKISLSSSISGLAEKLVLHPSIMEAAWQGVFAILMKNEDQKSLVPNSLERLDILTDISNSRWAVIRRSENEDKVAVNTQRFDIDLCDESGVICAQIKGISFSEFHGAEYVAIKPEDIGVLLLRPDWQEKAVKLDSTSPIYEQHHVILCELHNISEEDVTSELPISGCLSLNLEKHGVEERFRTYAIQIFEKIKAILIAKPMGQVLLQLVVPLHGEKQLSSGLAGLLNTAHLENPKIIGQIIGVQGDESAQRITEILQENSLESHCSYVRYENGKRWLKNWQETFQQEMCIPWKTGGNYLITGGVGGLGLLFAKEIAQQAKGVTLVLTGRSPLDDCIQTRLEVLKALGARVEYRQVDVINSIEVSEILRYIQNNFGNLNGIVHSAGVIKDNFILKKSQEEFAAVMDPKVAGLVNLDMASRDIPLDFFILFSSGAGVMGNLGQADYATANAFMDAYAEYRNDLVELQQRQGQTLSINWPLWKEGGMHVDQVTENMMMQSMGMQPMRTETGIRALYHSMAAKQSQILVMEGNVPRMRENLLSSAEIVSGAQTYNSSHREESAEIRSKLLRLASGVLNIKVDDIDENVELTEYGFEPITLTKFCQAISREYGVDLDTYFLVDPLTIFELSNYLLNERRSTSVIQAQDNSIDLRNKKNSQVNLTEVNYQVLEKLKELFGKIIKLDASKINNEEPLDAYGIDSIMVMQLNLGLAEVFAGLSKTLFYEHQTLKSLSQYLVNGYIQECLSWTGLNAHAEQAADKKNIDRGNPPGVSLKQKQRGGRSTIPSNSENKGNEPIAIIGMSGRFPKARHLEEYWENLKAGNSCIEEIPGERWNWRDFYHENREEAGALGKSYSKWGAFLDDFERFDPLFFNISPKEAIGMDPQERLFLEESWRAFEDAGYVPSRMTEELRNKVGVYAGITKNGFNLWSHENVLFNTSFSSLVNRVSYHMDFHGPSVPVDTMCSSALVGLHQACTALSHGEIDIALVGAVNLYLHPTSYVALSQGQMISDRASCDVFGKGGNGFVPSEGVGAVVLKRLTDTERDNDNILAVIKGSAVNHSGRTNGYGVPNPQQQAAVIQQALKRSNIDPRTISYIESAANGSEMGDAIEITALNKALNMGENRLAIGSVKSLLGHGESVSGMAQLFKVILQLQHKLLCPTLMPKGRNPDINFDAMSFSVQTKLEEWKNPCIDGEAIPRRAGINSFGAGGVNAHVIVEEYEAPAEKNIFVPGFPTAFILSAKTEQSLRQNIKVWKEYLETHPECDVCRIAASLQHRREAMKYRFGCVINNRDELIQCLAENDRAAVKTYFGNLNSGKSLMEGNIGKRNENIALLVAEKNLEQLVNLWVNGASIPWINLYGGVLSSHVSQIPTYPFTQKRYWLGSVKNDSYSEKKVARFIPLALDSVTDTEETTTLTEILPWREELHKHSPDYVVETRGYAGVSRILYTGEVGHVEASVAVDQGDVVKTMLKILERILYLDEQDEVDCDVSFVEIGLNSINIVNFIHELNHEFKLDLIETIVFDYANINDLARLICKEIAKRNDAALVA